MENDSQSESTEPANKEMHVQEDALPSALLIANDERAAFPSTGAHAEAAANLDMSARTVQMWLVLYMPLVTSYISDQSATQV
jgi:hypothetical protein